MAGCTQSPYLHLKGIPVSGSRRRWPSTAGATDRQGGEVVAGVLSGGLRARGGVHVFPLHEAESPESKVAASARDAARTCR
jgi:hypothetical protein